jgi:CRISPR-associated exonuclease Cas4
LLVNGTLIWYYYICKRQVWLLSRSISSDQENELLLLGKHISKIFLKRNKISRKEILVDNRIRIDFLKDKIVAEIKKSSKFILASKMQLAFYLYYFKYYKDVLLNGELIFPEENKSVEVILDENLEKELEKTISEIESIIKTNLPPKPIKIGYCKKCAFKEVCWS